MIVALLGVFLGLGGVGVAATGGNFILGQSNTAGAKTSLTAGMSDRALAITNLSKGSSATALGLNVDPRRPPLIVNSSTKVANLNSDQLDGRDSTNFLPKSGKAADSAKLDGIDSSGLIQGTGKHYQQRITLDTNTVTGTALDIPGLGEIIGTCSVTPYGTHTKLSLHNTSGE